MRKVLTLTALLLIICFSFSGCFLYYNVGMRSDSVPSEVYDPSGAAFEQAGTETAAQPVTEKPETKEDKLKGGYWIRYSPQALMYEAYVFLDNGILEVTEYEFENGAVNEFRSTEYCTYSVSGNQIIITDDNGEWNWSFTDNDDLLEYQYTEYIGGDRDKEHTVTQKIYRHDSLPDHDTAVSERK